MQRLVILLTIIVAALALYRFMPAEQMPSGPLPDAISEHTRTEARQHIKSLTRQAADDTLDITQADHFVTGSQLLQLPPPAQENAISADLEPTQNGNATSYAADLPPGNTPTTAQPYNLTPQDRLRLQELLNNPDQAADEIFYVHSVGNADAQGLWGIIHQGLIETFTRGIRIEDRSRLLSAQIPADADEPLADQRSSWLGHLLKRKVQDTWVFNYQQGLLGHNPDVIYPGQQLVIVRFSEDELISIYNHFTRADAR
ncbi:MAG: hypothetical protein GYB41_13600 [Oceanospirillales bacterium]|nr:hypothetical protein [Oceanospirillales bacterium]